MIDYHMLRKTNHNKKSSYKSMSKEADYLNYYLYEQS